MNRAAGYGQLVEIIEAAGPYTDPGEDGASYLEHLRRPDLSVGTYCLRG